MEEHEGEDATRCWLAMLILLECECGPWAPVQAIVGLRCETDGQKIGRIRTLHSQDLDVSPSLSPAGEKESKEREGGFFQLRGREREAEKGPREDRTAAS